MRLSRDDHLDAVYHHGQQSRKSSQYELHLIRRITIQADIAEFACVIPAIPNSLNRTMSAAFSNFQLSIIPTMDLSITTILSLDFYRPTLIARYTRSDAPEPQYTSTYVVAAAYYRCRQILTSGEESLNESCNSATSHLLLATTIDATDVMQVPMVCRSMDTQYCHRKRIS